MDKSKIVRFHTSEKWFIIIDRIIDKDNKDKIILLL